MTNIALLRGINVSGKNMIKMPVLVGIFESLGFRNIETYLQSGNVIFDTEVTVIPVLEEMISSAINKSTGLNVPVIIRQADQLKKIRSDQPFKKEDESLQNSLYVVFLSKEPEPAHVNNIKDIKNQTDEFVISGREIYLFCPGGYGNTKFSNNFFENKLKLTATTRNWKTLLELIKRSLE